MRTFLLILSVVVISSVNGFGQTAHEAFMSSKIKTNTTGDFNTWVHGDNDFSTVTNDDWNNWSYAYLGLEGEINTLNTNDFTNWKIANTGITITNTDGSYNNWTVTGDGRTINLTTTNWNTWVLNGSVIGGISTTDTDDFSEWELQGGDWTSIGPQMRAATVFISVFSSAVLKNL